MTDAPRARLLRRAVALLARREHAPAELARKLAVRLDDGQDPADVDWVVAELLRQGLLSEARYASSLVRTRAARYGDARLAQELKARGVAPASTRAALDPLRGTERQRAHALWQRHFGTLPDSLAERARQARYLERRGFAADVIRDVLRGRAPDDEGCPNPGAD